jgi:hypothetical protein
MPVTDVMDVAEERRQKRIVLILFSVCALGATYLLYDYFSSRSDLFNPSTAFGRR